MGELGELRVGRSANVLVAHLTGEIDASNTAVLRGQMEREIPNDVRAVIVALSDVEFVDSSGMELLFGLQSRLDRHAIELHVVLPRHAVIWRTLEIAGFRPSGGAYPDLPAALAALDVESA